MAVRDFSPVSWSPNEPITDDKLDQMTSNEQYLFDHQSSTFYNAHGIKRDKGMKILAGLVFIPASKSSQAWVTAYFNNFFSSGCWPIITTAVVSQAIPSMHHNIHGIGGVHPDNRGFVVHAVVAAAHSQNNFISHGFFISYIALGY